MLALISFLGIVLLSAALLGYFLRNRLTQFPVLSLFQNKKVVLYLVAIGSFMTLSNQLFFYARFGHQYYLVYPTGGWSTVFTSGIKLRWFATIQEWQKEIDIKVVGDGEPTEGIEGVIADKVTF